MEKYFLYIWLIIVIYIVSTLYFKGKKTIKEFGEVDVSNTVYSEKFASGYSCFSRKTKRGGASKTLHIIITDKELILKTSLFFAYFAKEYDMLHRIPLKNVIKTDIKKSFIFSKLIVTFLTEKELFLMSNKNNLIQEILEREIPTSESKKQSK